MIPISIFPGPLLMNLANPRQANSANHKALNGSIQIRVLRPTKGERKAQPEGAATIANANGTDAWDNPNAPKPPKHSVRAIPVLRPAVRSAAALVSGPAVGERLKQTPPH